MKNAIVVRATGFFILIIIVVICIINSNINTKSMDSGLDETITEGEASTELQLEANGVIENTTTANDKDSLQVETVPATTKETTVKETTAKETTVKETTTKETTTKETTIETTVEVTTTQPVTYSQMTDEQIMEKLKKLAEIFPAGKYWNHFSENYDVYSVTDIPCNHDKDYNNCNTYVGMINTIMPYWVTGKQCLGFASLCSDYIFGKSENIRAYYDFDQIQIGDQIRTNVNTIYGNHSALIIDKTDEYIVVMECNADYKTCKIGWGE